MVSTDLGFDKENVLYVESRDGFIKSYKALREEWLQCPAHKRCHPEKLSADGMGAGVDDRETRSRRYVSDGNVPGRL